jgi:hypothetical protein
MPAHEDSFPWTSYYGHYRFFEERMKQHDKVKSVNKLGDGLYQLALFDKNIKVFICECYSYGIAEYHETVGNIGALDAVVINSNWCGYTTEVKLHCYRNKVGVYTIGELMAALNLRNIWEYLSKEEKEALKKERKHG